VWTGEYLCTLNGVPTQPHTFVLRGWDVNPGGPPAWLFAVTAAGLLLVVADWRRGRKHAPRIVQAV